MYDPEISAQSACRRVHGSRQSSVVRDLRRGDSDPAVALGTPSRSRWWLGPVWGIMENVTTAEHMAGRLDAAKLERLSAEFEAVGYVFLDNVVPDHEVPTNSGCG